MSKVLKIKSQFKVRQVCQKSPKVFNTVTHDFTEENNTYKNCLNETLNPPHTHTHNISIKHQWKCTLPYVIITLDVTV